MEFFAEIGFHLVSLYLQNEGHLVFHQVLRPLENGLVGDPQFFPGTEQGLFPLVDTGNETEQLPQVAGLDNSLKVGQANLSVVNPRQVLVFGG